MSDLKWMRPRLAELVGDAEPKAYDEDVAQAVRCLEALRPRGLTASLALCGDGWSLSVRMKRGNRALAHKRGDALPSTVCLAIAAALGWEP